MATTRAFKTGKFQVIQVPAELAYAGNDIELEIERVGDELRIRPARESLADVPKLFAALGPDFLEEGRGDQEQADREKL